MEEPHAFFAVVFFNSTSTPTPHYSQQNCHVIPSLLLLVFLLSLLVDFADWWETGEVEGK